MVKVGLLQLKCKEDKEYNVRRAIEHIDKAAKKEAQIVCLQELFFYTFFPQHLKRQYYELAERIPGPTTNLLCEVAKSHSIVIVAPIYEEELPGVYYNTSVIIGPNGAIEGKYRKNHIPHLEQFQEKFYFKPGNLGYPVFRTPWCWIGVLICYDRHFPEGARILGLRGAEIVFIPTATTRLSRDIWEAELKGHAIANNYFVCGLNRVGVEDKMDFYGSSCFIDPKGHVFAQASDKDEAALIADIDISRIREQRKVWQFYRDRRPETYGAISQLVVE